MVGDLSACSLIGVNISKPVLASSGAKSTSQSKGGGAARSDA